MKKMTKLFAGLATAAALFGVSCTNQLDYLDQTTARNAFNVAGLYVEGLDSVYNGATVELYYKTDDNYDANGAISSVSWEKYSTTTTVAKSFTQDNKTVGYKSGTAYVSFADDDDALYDGDKIAGEYYKNNGTEKGYSAFAASKYECYISVNGVPFKTINEEGETAPAALTVPTSPAGTADASLASRWVKVVVNGDSATYSLVSSVKEPINSTLAKCSLSIWKKTKADDLPEYVSIKTSDKAGTNSKYTLTLKGLESNAGMKITLGGGNIGLADDDDKVGTYWTTESDDFVKTISEKGEISWTFYGKHVDSNWNRTYENNGPEIIVYDYNGGAGDQNSNNHLLDNSDSVTGDGGNKNFMFPIYTDGKDVECTIDFSAMTKGTDYTQEDAVVSADSFKVAGILIANAPVPENGAVYITTPDGLLGNAKQKASYWEIPSNKYDNTATKHYTGTDINTNGNFEWMFEDEEVVTITPNAETFSLGIRLVDASDSAEDNKGTIGNFWGGDLTSGGACTATYNTAEFKDGTYAIYYDYKSGLIALVNFDDVPWFAKKEITLKFKVTGASEYKQVWINGDMWSGWALGWPISSWQSPLKEGYTPVAVGDDGTATFGENFNVSVANFAGTELSYGFKVIASKDGNWAGADYDPGDLKLEYKITDNGDVIVTIDISEKTAKVTSVLEQ